MEIADDPSLHLFSLYPSFKFVWVGLRNVFYDLLAIVSLTINVLPKGTVCFLCLEVDCHVVNRQHGSSTAMMCLFDRFSWGEIPPSSLPLSSF